MSTFSYIFYCYFITIFWSSLEIKASALSYKNIGFRGKLNKKCKGLIKNTLIQCKYLVSFYTGT